LRLFFSLFSHFLSIFALSLFCPFVDFSARLPSSRGEKKLFFLCRKTDRKHLDELSLRFLNNSLVTDGFGRFFRNDDKWRSVEVGAQPSKRFENRLASGMRDSRSD
jgi:hypothetical protein